jgi:cell division GTPase FtsZ
MAKQRTPQKATTRKGGKTTTTHSSQQVDPLYDTPPPRAARPAEHPAVKTRAKAPAELPEVEEPDLENSYEGTGIDLPDLDMEPQVEEGDVQLEDQFDTAVRMAFVGAGQGGGRIAEAFHKLGYARVCAVNTTDQDLRPLDIPGKLVIGKNRGGAGKDPEQGRAAAVESAEDIMDLLMRCWGQGVEQVWVCVGAGGGSGTGSWEKVVDIVHEYCASTDIEKPAGKHIGVIMTIPKRSEGSRVQTNAYKAIKQALALAESGHISSLVLVDNARIHELFPRLPVKRFWSVANTNFAACLHTFNVLAAQNSEYNTFDRADFRSVLRNGLMIFGMTRVHKWMAQEDISQAVRKNLEDTLLAEGFDLSTANMAGAIMVAHDSILEEIPMENIDYAFNSLGRVLGNEGITLHNGIYEGRRDGMRVFTIISGLEPPKERLEELEALSI